MVKSKPPEHPDAGEPFDGGNSTTSRPGAPAGNDHEGDVRPRPVSRPGTVPAGPSAAYLAEHTDDRTPDHLDRLGRDAEDEAVTGTPPELLMALDRALAQPPRDVPRMELARSLEEAGPRTFVYIDNQGRVRSPVQYRLMQVFSYSMLAAILVGGTALYASLLGPQGLLFGVVFSALVGRNLRLTRQINQAALLSSHDRLDEAEVLLRRLLGRRMVGRRLRALIHHNLGAVATRRGDHEEALSQLRSAIALYQAAWRRSPHLRSCQYGEVIALCNLRRADEARQRLLSLPEQSEGDYLLVKFWTTELYVRFCRGEVPPEDTALWDRSERALKITSSAALLALCAWGFTKTPSKTGGKQPDTGNLDMAWHLLREAFERLDGEPLRTIMPPLWQWMADNRGTAEAAA